MTVDMISSDGDGRDDSGARTAPPSPPPLRTGARATALTTAVSLVLVGGIAVAAYRNATGSTAPDEVVPASAFGYAQVDLDLPSGQDAALSAFLGHFPNSPTHHGNGSVRDKVLRAMLHDSSDPHVDYDKDVRPWLGNRAAVAGWLDSGGKPQVEYVLRSTDDAKARASLRRVAPTVGVVFHDGYAVIGTTPALAQQALTAAEHASLAHAGTYRHDVSVLPGTQAATAWINGPGAVKAIATATHGLADLRLLPQGRLFTSRLNSLKGREVAGVHFTHTYGELDARTIGMPAETNGTTSSSLLRQLPDHTLAAVELANAGSLVNDFTSALGLMFGTRRSISVGASGSVTVSPNGRAGTTGSVVVPAPPLEQAVDPLTQILRATGLSLPGDAKTLLGSAAVISYGGLHTGGLPDVALRSKPSDLAAAEAVANHSRSVIAQHSGLELTVSGHSGDLVVATNPSYADAVETGGHLDTQPSFAAAMGTIPDRVSVAAYVDLGDILPLFSHGDVIAAHFKAFGIWASDDAFQARLVAG